MRYNQIIHFKVEKKKIIYFSLPKNINRSSFSKPELSFFSIYYINYKDPSSAQAYLPSSVCLCGMLCIYMVVSDYETSKTKNEI